MYKNTICAHLHKKYACTDTYIINLIITEWIQQYDNYWGLTKYITNIIEANIVNIYDLDKGWRSLMDYDLNGGAYLPNSMCIMALYI